MEAFLDFFEFMPNWQKLLWIVICLSFNWIIEAVRPLFNHDYQKTKHVGVNMIFLMMDLSINVIFGLATIGIFAWASEHQFGLLYMIDFPIWVELILAIMILDLVAQYSIHFLLHKVPWMWRFHMIHHSDTHVDATTGTRHHPGDYVTREIFALIAIILSGIPLAYYLFYRILTVFFAYFTHANISLPKRLDQVLSVLFVTPNMHKFHHHFERPWTDTNFGNIFSLWDRMFGTLTYEDPHDVRFGLDVLDDTKDENIGYQLMVPFSKEVKTDPDKNFFGFSKSK